MLEYALSRHLVISAVICLMLFSGLTTLLSLCVEETTIHTHMRPESVRIAPQYSYIGQLHDQKYKCQSNTSPHKCYGVQQIYTAYSIAPLLQQGITGKGRTIVILDAYQAPDLAKDMAAFNQRFAVQSAPLTVIAPYGVPTWNARSPTQINWSGEITLDVEWAHAIAPGARIVLVEAKSDDDSDLVHVLNYAIDHNLGDVISMSFGEEENCPTSQWKEAWHKAFYAASRKEITLLASAGDTGTAQQTCDGNAWLKGVSIPAADPLVTGIGGTTLDADAITGQYHNEVTWSEPTKNEATGGGFSKLISMPFYQQLISDSKHGRALPDVAYDASPLHGVISVWSEGKKGPGGIYEFGGTSAGAPQWAGLIALADQYGNRRIGFINSALYVIGQSSTLYAAAFHDIVSGSNTLPLMNNHHLITVFQGNTAGPGWDATTGWGSPIAAQLIPMLSYLTLAHNGAYADLQDSIH
ncbi:S53 family peptidase [Dictyobacter arantiisoli]|uniref:Serine protease n=1 Tax=Dictyobacter arantiisoli TaxID=2014874 RepID=A0A5A5T5U6_9CHLR|nr:S53 family peptidase [Dictyobacter arantiisoli]GCF06566.1 serine protease [Dictyobacter arantiisoli]